MWSVREHARRRGTTASTINRAYRNLAENGVIVLGDRRRARVAPDGALAAAQFLEPGGCSAWLAATTRLYRSSWTASGAR